MSLAGRALLFGLLALTGACGKAPPAVAPAGPPKRIVLVTIDTWRADAIGASGSGRVATPNLDAFAKGGLYCAKAWTSATLTAPAHGSILTGLQPYHHGIRNNHGFALDPSANTLAALLAARGFATAAFVSAHPVARVFGFDRGFSVYDDHVAPGDLLAVAPRWRKGAETIEAASRWLHTAPDRFFLWVHLYEPHDPYDPPEPHRTTYRSAPYFGEVAYADELVGRLKSALGPAGERDALWVLTGDHGEALGSHGEATHGLFVYDSTARVPLIVWAPGVIPASRVELARSVDIVPTVLAALGLDVPAGLDGVSLLAPRASPVTPYAYVEAMYPALDFGAAPIRALSDGKLKLIDVPRREIYDLAADPEESRNLASGAHPPGAGALTGALASVPAALDSPGKTGDDDAKALRSLGYVGAGGAYSLAGAGMDPKDFAPLYRGLDRVRLLCERRQFAEAVPAYTELIAAFPRSSLLWGELGLVQMALGRSATAESSLRRALDLNPGNSHARLGLAQLAISRNDPRAAEAHLLAVLKLDANDVEANFNLGALYYQTLGQPAKAALYWKRFLELQPDDPEAPRLRQLMDSQPLH